MFCTLSLQNALFATAACNRNFKKCSETVSSLAFSIPNVLLATAACIFLTFELQKVLSLLTFSLQNVLLATAACNFWFLLWAPTSAPAALTGLLFDWPGTRIIEKNTAFRDFSNIWRGCIFFLLTFALLHLLSVDLTTLLCFSTVHIVGSLLFKLPSINTPVESVDHKALGICHSCFSTKCFLISLRYAVFSFAFTPGQIGRGQGPEPRVDRTSWKQVIQKCQSGSNKILSNT